jgi:fatty-acyl-CoA synthase
MQGLMMDWPLLIQQLLDTAATRHPGRGVVSRDGAGRMVRLSYAEIRERTLRLAAALIERGVGAGDRVATLEWNTHRHFELYFAISGVGAVCHTLNPRLAPETLEYIIGHANDMIVFYDPGLEPLVTQLRANLPGVREWIALDAAPNDDPIYESLLATPPLPAWPEFDERCAAGLCYTSGTTGEPKGVLYSHRSTVLHAMAICAPDVLGISSSDTILPFVPLFHVNAWGVPYAAALAGANLVLPGPQLEPEPLYELLHAEEVTLALGVPTVWLRLLEWCAQHGRQLHYPRRAVVGGAPLSAALLDALEAHGISVHHGWGMTEMSPIGTINVLKREHAVADAESRRRRQLSQGRFPHLCDARIVTEDGTPLPADGVAQGALQVRGPWIARRYFRAEADATTADGWFDTGDVATIDADGYLRIVDRSKDLIKSGGEWISSIALEDAATSDPQVALAAAVGAPDPMWQERPVLFVVPRDAGRFDVDALRRHLASCVAKWWVPERIEVVDALPLGATGKVQKSVLRERVNLPAADA